MESILRTTINAALSSFILPVGEDDLELSREQGFILRDVELNQDKVNELLDQKSEGTVTIERCLIQKLKVNYDWVEGTAHVELENLTFAVAPRVGKIMKKKLLGCLDYREDDDMEARRRGAMIYDGGWAGPSPPVDAGPKYCPNCSFDLQPFSNPRDNFRPSPPRLMVSHHTRQLPPPEHVPAYNPGPELHDRRRDVTMSGAPLLEPPLQYREPSAPIHQFPLIPHPQRHTSPSLPYDAPLLRPPVGSETSASRARKKSIGCSAVLQNVRDQLDPPNGVPHPYMAADKTPLKWIGRPNHGRPLESPHDVDYGTIADPDREWNGRYPPVEHKKR